MIMSKLSGSNMWVSALARIKLAGVRSRSGAEASGGDHGIRYVDAGAATFCSE